MKKKKWIITSVILVVFCAGLFVYNHYRGSSSAADPAEISIPRKNSVLNVNGLVVRPQTLTDGITSVGSLLPDEEVDLSFETSGKIVSINFQEGSTGRKKAADRNQNKKTGEMGRICLRTSIAFPFASRYNKEEYSNMRGRGFRL